MGRTGRCGEHLLVGTETPAMRGPTIARCAPTCPAPRVQAPGCAPVSGDVPGPGRQAPPVCTMGSEDLRPACVLWTSTHWLRLSFLTGTPRARPTRRAATVTGGSVGAPGSPPQPRPLRGGAWWHYCDENVLAQRGLYCPQSDEGRQEATERGQCQPCGRSHHTRARCRHPYLTALLIRAETHSETHNPYAENWDYGQDPHSH